MDATLRILPEDSDAGFPRWYGLSKLDRVYFAIVPHELTLSYSTWDDVCTLCSMPGSRDDRIPVYLRPEYKRLFGLTNRRHFGGTRTGWLHRACFERCADSGRSVMDMLSAPLRLTIHIS